MRLARLMLGLAAGLALACGCSSNSSPAKTATTLATAPPPQTPVAQVSGAATQQASLLSTPQPPPPEVVSVVDKVKIKITELPKGFSYGQFQFYQANAEATNGYAVDPAELLDRMNKTGRLGGYVQSILTGDSPGGAAVTIEVWKDADGAKAYFDNYPRPAKEVQWQEITLPQTLGQQVFAYHYTYQSPSGTQAGYSLSWRNGRLILGVGELLPQGHETLDKLMVLANILDQHATAAQP